MKQKPTKQNLLLEEIDQTIAEVRARLTLNIMGLCRSAGVGLLPWDIAELLGDKKKGFLFPGSKKRQPGDNDNYDRLDYYYGSPKHIANLTEIPAKK